MCESLRNYPGAWTPVWNVGLFATLWCITLSFRAI